MTTMAYASPTDRLRGTKKVKVGFRPDIAVTMRGEGDTTAGPGGRRQKTPIQRSREELSKSLESYNVSDILKREIISEAIRLDTVTTMNMATLASVMVYLRNYPEPEPDDFTDEILAPYLDTLMQDFITPPKATGDPPTLREQEDVRYRYKQTILRYILKVLALRAGNQLFEVVRPVETEIVVGGKKEQD